MPLPLILAAGGAITGALLHKGAKDKNEKAQALFESAQSMYEDEKSALDSLKQKTENTLINYAYSKKKVLDTSMKTFVSIYDKIKTIKLSSSEGINEISKFDINSDGIMELQKMTDIYTSSFASGATGAATGVIISLAASGSIPIIASTLSTAGTALAIGEFGMAASLASSAVSFGAAMTPLAAVAAPVVIFTGISSTIKAEENYEKARAQYKQAEKAVEEMKLSQDLCNAIIKKTGMFDNLLCEMNIIFLNCTMALSNIISQKGSSFSPSTMTREEKELAAVTRSFAGAIKAILDTPIMESDGTFSDTAMQTLEVASDDLNNRRNSILQTSRHLNEKAELIYNEVKADWEVDFNLMIDSLYDLAITRNEQVNTAFSDFFLVFEKIKSIKLNGLIIDSRLEKYILNSDRIVEIKNYLSCSTNAFNKYNKVECAKFVASGRQMSAASSWDAISIPMLNAYDVSSFNNNCITNAQKVYSKSIDISKQYQHMKPLSEQIITIANSYTFICRDLSTELMNCIQIAKQVIPKSKLGIGLANQSVRQLILVISVIAGLLDKVSHVKILQQDGELTEEAVQMIDEVNNVMPVVLESVNAVKQIDYSDKKAVLPDYGSDSSGIQQTSPYSQNQKNVVKVTVSNKNSNNDINNILAIIISGGIGIGSGIFLGLDLFICIMVSLISCISLFKSESISKWLSLVNKGVLIGYGVGCCYLFYKYFLNTVYGLQHPIIALIAAGIISFFVFLFVYSAENNNFFKKMIATFASEICIASAVLLISLIISIIGIPLSIIMILAYIVIFIANMLIASIIIDT